MPTYSIENHLLIPFACEKWKIQDIKISRVSPSHTYFEANIPLVYINKAGKRPLTLDLIEDITNSIDFSKFYTELDLFEKLDCIRDVVKTWVDSRSFFEAQFIDLYFEYLKIITLDYNDKRKYCKFAGYSDTDGNIPQETILNALLPIPQAHLYLDNPYSLTSSSYYEPLDPIMVKVDFLFWDGYSLIAVEIDGKSHIGDEKHILRDRELKKSGVDTYHIINDEIIKHGHSVITEILPDTIKKFWLNKKK